MPQKLKELLKVHAFSRNALRKHADSIPTDHAHKLRDLEARAFRDILVHRSDNPRITHAQIRFAMECLADDTPATDATAMMREAAAAQSVRLERALLDGRQRRRQADKPDFHAFDALTDRIAVFDRDYRYVFTNKANLEFHRETLHAFEHRPNWDMTGERFFEVANKPRFDACFAGNTVHGYSMRPDNKTFSTSYTPIRDADGEIRSVILVARDVTHLPIPRDEVEAIEVAVPVNPRP